MLGVMIMDNLSRTKKNNQLYQKLHSDNETQISSDRLSLYANRLHEIDNERFSEMTTNATSDNPLHAKKTEYLNTEPAPQQISSFNNEYLDEFISEVKQYNIKKGLRAVEDTQTNILKEVLKKDIEVKKEDQVIDKEINTIDQEMITSEMQKMIDTDYQPNDIDNEFEDEMIKPAQEVSHHDVSYNNEEILAETAKLKKIVQDHDNELLEVNNHVSSTNRILNFVLIILFLTLLLALGGLVYFLLTNRGFL
jgi:hypothetical protein